MGKLSEKKEREKRVCGGIRGAAYGTAEGKQNVSRLQRLREHDGKAMQARDR